MLRRKPVRGESAIHSLRFVDVRGGLRAHTKVKNETDEMREGCRENKVQEKPDTEEKSGLSMGTVVDPKERKGEEK
jgi:hypothetical protein